MIVDDPCPSCGASGTRMLKFRIEDSGEYRVICESCHPDKVEIHVDAKASASDGSKVKVADVHVSGTLDWTRSNPLIEFEHDHRHITGAFAALEAPWYAKLGRAFGRIFRPSAVSDPSHLA